MKDELAYYWRRNPLLNVKAYDTRYDDWRNMAALEAGERGDPAARRALELAARYGPSDLARPASALLRNLPVA
ncbi:hypothetical protein M1P56_17015 [Streptomyces sp. HU2014]|uniref:hypothetical protein n=1 Tax=Streptomyces sp. HU2014 TaxID=2939414 RepID=UPI0020107309|nr:hypothetical protein [Streptomyces sp. HU2014]UQI45934.1 hypothetical protein M1P56_17015 [Streptomyces sp. HU2014]